MRKYHGNLIHRSRDGYGPIEIIDDGHTRSLHFGNGTRQSAAILHQPGQLLLVYTRVMMSCLLFQPAPRHALLIGLGGGSLAKFLLHHFPDCEVHAVERRAAVAKLAFAYFQLPDTPRLQVHIQDAGQFIQDTRRPPYDLILLDAYDEHGMAPGMEERDFLHACRAALSPQGILAANLWGRERARFKLTLSNLHACFGARPLQLPAEGTTNIITFSAGHALPKLGIKPLPAAMKTLEARCGLELGKFARRLQQHNGTWWERLFA